MSGKLLVVSWTLYPWTSGSSIVVNNLASQFTSEEMVLFGEREPRRETDGWPGHFPRIYYHEQDFNSETSRCTVGAITEGKVVRRGQRQLRWLKIRRLINEICALIEREKVDRVLGVFPDDFYLYAAYRAAKRMELPFYTWFHNTYLDNYARERKLFARWFEPKVFEMAQTTFLLSQGMRRYFEVSYPKQKFEVLEHGFPLVEQAFQPFQIDREKVRFVYTGSLNISCEDAAIRLMKTILRHPNYEVHVFSGSPLTKFTAHGLGGTNFIYHGFVDEADFYQKIGECDIALLPHGFDGARTDVEFKTIFPTRTIPLLTCNRPILAHTPKGVYFTEFLQENQCAAIVDTKDEAAIETAINRLIEDTDYRAELVQNAMRTAPLFDVKRVAGKLREVVGL